MEFDSQVLAFVVVAALLTITPGVDTLLVLKNAGQEGLKAGLYTTLGICSGLFVHAVLSAIGLSVFFLESAMAFAALKFLGACYLAWMGVQSIRLAVRGSAIKAANNATVFSSPLLQGFISNVLNPKVIAFYLALLPQFLSPGDPVLVKSLFLASLHWIMGMLWLATLSFAVGRGRNFFSQAKFRTALHGMAGRLLIGLAGRLATLER